MIKKLLATAIAAMLVVSFSATAFAAPDDPSASPTNSTAPSASASIPPEGSPAPSATAEGNNFIEQVKAMRAEVNVLKALLKTEREYDQKVRSEIRALQGIVEQDKETVKTYQAELKALTKKIQDFTKQLKAAKKANDTTLITSLDAAIKAAKTERDTLVASHKSLIDQLKDNKLGRRSLKPLRELLKPEYEKLRVLIAAAKDLDKDVHELMKDLKTALKALDITTAATLVDQIRAKFAEQKLNIQARIDIRKGMSTILDTYKAGLEPPK